MKKYLITPVLFLSLLLSFSTASYAASQEEKLLQLTKLQEQTIELNKQVTKLINDIYADDWNASVTKRTNFFLLQAEWERTLGEIERHYRENSRIHFGRAVTRGKNILNLLRYHNVDSAYVKKVDKTLKSRIKMGEEVFNK